MKLNFVAKDLTAGAGKATADVLIVLAGADGVQKPAHTGKAGKTAAGHGVAELLAAAVQAQDWSGKVAQELVLYAPTGAAARRVVMCGLGAEGEEHRLRDGLEQLLRREAARKGVQHVALCFVQDATPAQLQAVVLGAGAGAYRYTETFSKPEPGVETLTLSAPNARALKDTFAQAEALLAGVTLAREWANRPANVATPSALAGVAEDIVRQADSKAFECTVLGPAAIAKLGMGAFLAVTQGSYQEPRFIVLQYNGASSRQAPLVFVGKGITFDTGGISLKPGPGMDEMKFDMSGAASVLGLFEALRHLRPAINVVGLIPTCENMPSGRSVKPGDVVTSMSGQTIEVLNTDAEGRLILCDALTYAERFKPRAVVDIATLTGNCKLALGGVRSGLFTTNDALAAELERAANVSDDLCWRMPMDDAYGKALKSNFADMANITGTPAGGAIAAAKFLEKFTGEYPWAHLDIAGTAWNSGAAKGATGRPVPLLLEFVQHMAQTGAVFAADKADKAEKGTEPSEPSGKTAAAPKKAKSGKTSAARKR